MKIIMKLVIQEELGVYLEMKILDLVAGNIQEY